MKSSRKIRENVLFTWGYSRNKVKSRHFRTNRAAHQRPIHRMLCQERQRSQKDWDAGCEGTCVDSDQGWKRQDPLKSKGTCVGLPWGQKGTPTENLQSKRGGQRPLQMGQEQTRAEEALSPQDRTAESCCWGEVCATAVGALRRLWRLRGLGTHRAGPQQSTSSSPVTTGSSANSLWGTLENCLQSSVPNDTS